MGATTDLRNYLKDDTARVRFGLFTKIVTASGKTVEVGQNATNAEVAQALTGSSMTDPLPVVEIAPATVTAPATADPVTSNITGLQSGAFQDALVQMRQTIADRQKRAVAKIVTAVDAGTAKLEAAADEVAAKVDKEIAASLQEFATMTNGGPA